MATIQIKHIGALTNTGIVPLTPVLLFIGKQSSGKSTLMKILCFCRWLEKLIMVESEKDVVFLYTHNLKFQSDLMRFHRFNETYFSKDSSILYEGDTLRISWEGFNSNSKIEKKADFEKLHFNTKLSFIPSERNLISAIKNVDRNYKASDFDLLFNFMLEWDEARNAYTANNPVSLSVSDQMDYVNEGGIDVIRLKNNNKSLSAFYVSSGVQSAMPIEVMVDYFTKQVGQRANVSKHDLTKAIRRMMESDENVSTDTFSQLANHSVYQSVQLFIEEPEQNLYPDAQRDLLLKIIQKIKIASKISPKHQSMVVFTTHSPYVLSVLNVLISLAHIRQSHPDFSLSEHLIDEENLFGTKDFSAYYIRPDGTLISIIDKEIPMISGEHLDGVSDWVDDQIAKINTRLYGE